MAASYIYTNIFVRKKVLVLPRSVTYLMLQSRQASLQYLIFIVVCATVAATAVTFKP